MERKKGRYNYPTKTDAFYTPAEITRGMDIKVASEQELEHWLESYLRKEVFKRPVTSTLQELERRGANVVDVIECISLDVFSHMPMKFPGRVRSRAGLDESAKLLEDAAQFIDKLYELRAPILQARGLEVPESVARAMASCPELRKLANELRHTEPSAGRS